VVDSAFTSIVQSDFHLLAHRPDGNNRSSEPDRNILEPIHQPARAGWPNGSLPESVLDAARQSPQQLGPRHELANACRPNVRGRIEEPRSEFAHLMMKRPGSPSLQPMNSMRPRDDFDFGADFAE